MQVSRARLVEIVRYYQAGVLNTAFGLGIYAVLVRLGLNMYLAQLVAQVIGATFNYVTYSRHVFRDAQPAKLRFALSYVFNYLLSLLTLAAVARVIASPYLAGFGTAVIVSVVNYFILKHVIFLRKTA